MLVRVPGPYTAAQQSTAVVYPIPPAAIQHQVNAPAKQSAADPESEKKQATDSTKKGEGEAAGTVTGTENKGEMPTLATAGAVSI